MQEKCPLAENFRRGGIDICLSIRWGAIVTVVSECTAQVAAYATNSRPTWAVHSLTRHYARIAAVMVGISRRAVVPRATVSHSASTSSRRPRSACS